ncbi:MAG: AAA family ATPase [Eggerthellaceae bacterium]|nr:AAA family ATPase [Eggerthellaceae bacterium]
MNIQQAKEQISGAVRAYLSKDERGLPRVPKRMQRPLIMFGPPGVGKTAIVSQVAREMDINFVSYSITHHTRQSALGLPFISQEEFDGREYSVSDYTMSEIIAAVHRARKESGVDEGILFLDEVNCVSETLAPAMLQFLQFKTFGMHKLPDGWVIVCAGNPPEYNRSAREFDPAMLDRMRRIDVEPDVTVWQEYATANGVHPAVTTYLEAKPGAFYRVRAGASGPVLVTARGWEDLSRVIQAFEAEGLEPDAALVRQYLQDDQVANEVFAYYELFRKYQDDYQVTRILDGTAASDIASRAAEAQFDERVALVGLLLDAVLERVHAAMECNEALRLVRNDLITLKGDLAGSRALDAMRYHMGRVRHASDVGSNSASGVADRDAVRAERLRALGQIQSSVMAAVAAELDCFDTAKSTFNGLVNAHDAQVNAAMSSIDNAFSFLDETYGETSQESLILVTKLSADRVLVAAVANFGSEQYLKHNKNLMLSERNTDLLRQIEQLEEDETH